MTLTKEQAAQIHDFPSFQEVTGKRFKMFKGEKERNLSREDALRERIKQAATHVGQTVGRQYHDMLVADKAAHRGEIVIHIRPDVGVNSQYFENLPNGPVELRLDEKWFSWLDNRLIMPYDGDITRLLQHILDLGIGEVITQYNFPEDLNDDN